MNTSIRPVQVMIAGVAKAGTTSLVNYLNQHPKIHTHKQLEFNFFNDFEYSLGYQDAFIKYFNNISDEQTILLAKCAGMIYFPALIERLYKHNPDVKVLVILRNPIEQAYSHYWYNRSRGLESSETFEEAIEIERKSPDLTKLWFEDFLKYPCPYLDTSTYYPYIKRLIDIFGENQVSVIYLEDLKQNPDEVIQNIFDDLDIDSKIQSTSYTVHNQSVMPVSKGLVTLFYSVLVHPQNPLKQLLRKLLPKRIVYELSYSIRKFFKKFSRKTFTIPPMSTKTRKYLIQYFQPHNQVLADFLKKDLSSWE